MIQGHTFSALLRPGGLSAGAERWHTFLHGLTAPAFLFGAGLAFGTATYVDDGRHRAVKAPFSRRLSRYLLLLVLGYALQLPGGSLAAALRAEGEQLALVCRVGPLQLVAVVLGLLQVALWAVPTPRRHALLSAGLGLAVMLSATRVARSDLPENLGPLIGAFAADGGGAHFPIFPWAAFVLFGIACAGVRHEGMQFLPARSITAIGSLLACAGYDAYQIGLLEHDRSWWWRTSPSYFLFRVGLVLLLLGALHGRGSDREVPARTVTPSMLLARHSLVAYVAHLLLLYGTPATPNVALVFGKSLPLGGACAACALLLTATVGVTWAWHWLEREKLLQTPFKRAGLVLFGVALLAR